MKVALFFTLLAVAIIACPGCADSDYEQQLSAHWNEVRCEQAQGMGVYRRDCK